MVSNITCVYIYIYILRTIYIYILFGMMIQISMFQMGGEPPDRGLVQIRGLHGGPMFLAAPSSTLLPAFDSLRGQVVHRTA